MKLQNKKTGYVDNWCIDKDVIRTCDGSIVYNSIAELIADWEDYEEPKEKYHWFISGRGTIEYEKDADDYFNRGHKSIGNYFETKEEAEKALEKLKAWKRLKDKGFRFDGYDSGYNSNKELCGQAYFKGGNFWFDITHDLDLLFGGEE